MRFIALIFAPFLWTAIDCDRASAGQLNSAPCGQTTATETLTKLGVREQLCYLDLGIRSEGAARSDEGLATMTRRSLLVDPVSNRREIGPNLILLYYRFVLDRPFFLWAKLPDEWIAARRARGAVPDETKVGELQELARSGAESGEPVDSLVVGSFQCLAGDLGSGCAIDNGLRRSIMLNRAFGPTLERWAHHQLLLSQSGWAPLSGALEPDAIADAPLAIDDALYRFGNQSQEYCMGWISRPWMDVGVLRSGLSRLRQDPDYVSESLLRFRSLGGLGVFSTNIALVDSLKSSSVGIPIGVAFVSDQCKVVDFSHWNRLRPIRLVYLLI